MTGKVPGEILRPGDSRDNIVCEQDSVRQVPRGNTRNFRTCSRWYVACFSNGMKMQNSTPQELTMHFSPLSPQRGNESPVITPLVTYWAQA